MAVILLRSTEITSSTGADVMKADAAPKFPDAGRFRAASRSIGWTDGCPGGFRQ